MSLNPKSTITRAISGAAYVAIIVVCVLAGKASLIGLVVIGAIGASIEFSNINGAMTGPRRMAAAFDALCTLALVLSPLVPKLLIPLWVLLLILRCSEALTSHAEKSMSHLAVGVSGQIWVSLGLASVLYLGCTLGALALVLAVMILIWVNDTGAFLVGSLFGRRKLIERISPKKTWEGFIGGMVLTVIIAVLLPIIGPGYFVFDIDHQLGFNAFNSYWFWGIMGVMVCLFATMGDLVESRVKRFLGLKDSGNIIPGHGGLLDRIDSLLFVFPAVASCIAIVLYFLS